MIIYIINQRQVYQRTGLLYGSVRSQRHVLQVDVDRRLFGQSNLFQRNFVNHDRNAVLFLDRIDRFLKPDVIKGTASLITKRGFDFLFRFAVTNQFDGSVPIKSSIAHSICITAGMQTFGKLAFVVVAFRAITDLDIIEQFGVNLVVSADDMQFT